MRKPTVEEKQSEIGNKSNRRSREEWRAILQDFKASGLSGVAYCAERGLVAHQLRWWKREFAKESTDGKFMELRLPEVQAEYRIALATGRELVLKGSFSLEQTSQLIKLLESDI